MVARPNRLLPAVVVIQFGSSIRCVAAGAERKHLMTAISIPMQSEQHKLPDFTLTLTQLANAGDDI